MLLGFISLLLSVFQGAMQKICVRESIMHHMLPCPLPPRAGAKYGAAAFTGVLGGARRLLAEAPPPVTTARERYNLLGLICRPEFQLATGTLEKFRDLL